MIWFGGNSKLCKDIKKGLESEFEEAQVPAPQGPSALSKRGILCPTTMLPTTSTSHKF